MRLSVRRQALSCHEASGSLLLRCARLSLAGLSVFPRRLRAAVCVKSGDTVGGGGEDESGFGALHRDPGFGGGRGVKPGDSAERKQQEDEEEEEEKCRLNDVARQRESLAAYLWAGGSGK